MVGSLRSPTRSSPAPSYSAIGFTRNRVDDVGKETLSTMTTNGGRAFVLTERLERVIKDGPDEEKNELKAGIGSKAAKKKD